MMSRGHMKAFTLADTLVVLIIITILTGFLSYLIKLTDTQKNIRDLKRTVDLNQINNLITLIKKDNPRFNELDYASSNTIYISLPDNSATCTSWLNQLPSLPSGWSYRCSANPQNIDGTGWIPIPFKDNPLINISNLPFDPFNKSPYYYTFVATSGNYELTALLEKEQKEMVISNSDTKLTPIVRGSSNFVKTIGGSNDEIGYSVRQTSDSGYIIVGRTNSYGRSDYDVFVIKLDSLGNISWAKIIGGKNDDVGYDIKQTSDGGYIIVGSTNSYGAGDSDVFVIKLNSFGELIWAKVIGGQNYESGFSMQETSDGGYIILGNTNSYGDSDYDLLIIKLNSSGETSWAKVLSRPERYFIWSFDSIQKTSDGGYIISGLYYEPNTAYTAIFVIKLDNEGNISWAKRIGRNYLAYGLSIQQTSEGGYIIVGYTPYNGDLLVIKLDSLGSILWTKRINISTVDFGYSIQQTSDGGYVITGRTGGGKDDVFVTKLNSSGEISWTKLIGGTNSDWSYSIRQTYDKGYVTVGYTNSYGAGSLDIFLVKLNALGNCGDCSLISSVNPTITSISLDSSSLSFTTSSPSLVSNAVNPNTNSVSPSMSTLCRSF